MKKEENIRATLNQKARELDGEAQEFQRKLQNNAFVSRERAEQEHARLTKKQQDLQELQNRLTNELAAENQKNSLQLRDSINAFLKEYNKTKGYSMIISNTGFDNLLYADSAFNITKEIVEGLNARYTPASAAKKQYFLYYLGKKAARHLLFCCLFDSANTSFISGYIISTNEMMRVFPATSHGDAMGWFEI